MSNILIGHHVYYRTLDVQPSNTETNPLTRTIHSETTEDAKT
jgi:hypothetical protein